MLEIETGKAVVKVPSPVKGRVLKINKEIGDVAKVGKLLMVIAGEKDIVKSFMQIPSGA